MNDATTTRQIEASAARESANRPDPVVFGLPYGTEVAWDAPAGRQNGVVVGAVGDTVIVWNAGAGLRQKMDPARLAR